MKKDFRNHLLLQIEVLRGNLSHRELSKRLGPETERALARYIAGKAHLHEGDFEKIAKALLMDARFLAAAWAKSLDLHPPARNVLGWMIERAYRHWNRHTRLAKYRVPPSPSVMTIIRNKYADRLPRQTPPLWFKSSRGAKDTPEAREKFARAFQMLVAFVHERQSQRNVGAIHGLSAARAAQLMQRAAYTWARSEDIDLLHDRTVPFKHDSKLVKNLYAGLRFFAEQQFDDLTAQSDRNAANRGAWTDAKAKKR